MSAIIASTAARPMPKVVIRLSFKQTTRCLPSQEEPSVPPGWENAYRCSRCSVISRPKIKDCGAIYLGHFFENIRRLLRVDGDGLRRIELSETKVGYCGLSLMPVCTDCHCSSPAPRTFTWSVSGEAYAHVIPRFMAGGKGRIKMGTTPTKGG